MNLLKHPCKGLRQRTATTTAPQDLDELITHHQKMQDKIAEEMLILTQNLKGQSEIANKIIKKDTEVLEMFVLLFKMVLREVLLAFKVLGRSTQLTEQNFSKLKVESEKLAEHSKRAWKCWLWVMLVIVMVVFISESSFRGKFMFL